MPISCAALVAQPEPAIPKPRLNMKTWFSSAFATATPTDTHSVIVGRPTPLKKPRSDHRAMPRGPPCMRGDQYSRARSMISWGTPKGAKIHSPAAPSKTNKGTVNNDAQRAIHVACEARVYRRPPKDCATEVCTDRPMPPNSRTHTKIGQYTA